MTNRITHPTMDEMVADGLARADYSVRPEPPPRPLAARMKLDDRMALARFLDIYGPDTVLATIAEIRQSKQQRDKTDG